MNWPKRSASKIFPGSIAVHQRVHRGWTIPYGWVAPFVMAVDAALIGLSCLTTTVLYHEEALGHGPDLTPYIGLATVTAVLFLTIGKNAGSYEVTELLNLTLQIRRAAARWFAIFLFLTAVAFTMKVGSAFSRGAALSFWIVGLGLLLCSRVFWRFFLADGLAVRAFSSRQVAVLAEDSSASDTGITEALVRHGLQPAQRFSLPKDLENSDERESFTARVTAAIRGSNIEEIVVCANLHQWPYLKQVVGNLRILPLPVSFVPVGYGVDLFQLPFHKIGETVTFEIQSGPRTLTEYAVKRLLDIVVSGLSITALMPLLIMTALAIRLDSPGPIIFRQRRCGFNGRQFNIYKFRTMHVLENGEHVVQATKNDPRITTIGAWLRRTSIDELPQLFNVFRGEMSIVGPRPHALAHDDQFSQVVAKYAYRHHVKPGITGWAQVNGYRGETKTRSDIEHRVELDLYYIDNWTLGLDLRILFRTIIEVVRGENAY